MSKLKDMWERLQEQLAESRKIQQTIKELSKLSDKELHDIGIGRCDIHRIAEGAHR
jgi:uncharacterized protein YjiS (DUF1127 family)